MGENRLKHSKAVISLLVLLGTLVVTSYGLLTYQSSISTTGLVASANISLNVSAIDWGKFDYGTQKAVHVGLSFENIGEVDLTVNLTHTSLVPWFTLDLPADFGLPQGSTANKGITLTYNGTGTPGAFSVDIVVSAAET